MDEQAREHVSPGEASQQPEPEANVVNITGYRFLDLPDRDELRPWFREQCDALSLKGLILLSHEGINYFVAGTQAATDAFHALLESDAPPLNGRFKDIYCKVSYSRQPPFKRMLVKLKKEIISLGISSVKPAERTGLRLEPTELKQWLDEGKPCVLLDTRNDYEIRLGAFEQAVDMKLESFGEFPAAVAKLPSEYKQLPVVTYCTGGVRCEKATTVMQDAGFGEVYQLEGGILGYFEACGETKHWRGDCFVFDDRVALDQKLRETSAKMCFACREPVTLSDQASPKYVQGVSCPRCADKGTNSRSYHRPGGNTAANNDEQEDKEETGGDAATEASTTGETAEGIASNGNGRKEDEPAGELPSVVGDSATRITKKAKSSSE
jgi:UPF0176 protein